MHRTRRASRKDSPRESGLRNGGGLSACPGAHRLTVREARARFAETINRAAFAKERFALERHGKTVAAIVPPEDLVRLREVEGRLDAQAPRRALAERGIRRPYSQLRRKLGR
ncbi:MAG TPA: type II toxin-antitoxin system Phd/YefM family antitoxin [Planctomycetota bacterium]|nr:type II toxin-antitoxin system Phd/YefM family antitoxin [Planctomycetota bacterium]